MSELTPEARQKIYAEEKAKVEAQQKIKAEQNAKGVKYGCLGCFGIIALFVIIIGVASLFGPSAAEKAEAKCTDTTGAFVMSQTFVKKRLRSPSSAKFPWITDGGVGVKYLGNCVHEVGAYVDAQNAFGAMIRTRYYVKLQNQKGTDTWTALEVRIDGEG